MSSPSSEPTLLVSLVRAHHDRLEELLLEARRHPPTPGVMEDLRDQIVDVLTEDLYAEATVVHDAVRRMLGDDAHAGVLRDTHRLEEVLDAAEHLRGRASDDDAMTRWIDDVASALADHRALLDADLLPSMARTSKDEMAQLGYRYSEAMEVTGRHHR